MNKKWNDRLAVLLGDLLFAQASICLARIMNPVVVGIYGQVLGDLCAGEIRQMRQQFSTEISWDGYIRKTIGKTASLFQAGAHSGAILNAASDRAVQGLRDYGLNLGICFQIVDDLLDVIGESEHLIKSRAIAQIEGAQEGLELIRTNGGVEKTIALAAEYGAKSKESLCHLRPSAARDSLEHLVDYVLTRTR